MGKCEGTFRIDGSMTFQNKGRNSIPVAAVVVRTWREIRSKSDRTNGLERHCCRHGLSRSTARETNSLFERASSNVTHKDSRNHGKLLVV